MTPDTSQPFKALIFDLDGTLVDSVPDVCASANHVLTANGRRPLSIDETKYLVGWGGRVLVEKALALTGEPGTEAEIDAMLDGFLAVYAENPAVHTTLFPGVLDALDAFKAAGTALGICTNKPAKTTAPVLQAMGLERYFDVVSSGDAVPHRKPDGRHVLHVAEALGANRQTAAMIGDSENDIGAAIDAQVKSVVVSFGYAHSPPGDLGADALIDRFDDLPAALRRIHPDAAAN